MNNNKSVGGVFGVIAGILVSLISVIVLCSKDKYEYLLKCFLVGRVFYVVVGGFIVIGLMLVAYFGNKIVSNKN